MGVMDDRFPVRRVALAAIRRSLSAVLKSRRPGMAGSAIQTFVALGNVFAPVNQRNGHRSPGKPRVRPMTPEAKSGHVLDPLTVPRGGSLVTFQALDIISIGLGKRLFLFMAFRAKLPGFNGRRRFRSGFFAEPWLMVWIVARDAVGIILTSSDWFSRVQTLVQVTSYACPIMALEAGFSFEKIFQASVDLSRIGMGRSVDHARVTVLARILAVSRNMVPDRVHKPRPSHQGTSETKRRDSDQRNSNANSQTTGNQLFYGLRSGPGRKTGGEPAQKPASEACLKRMKHIVGKVHNGPAIKSLSGPAVEPRQVIIPVNYSDKRAPHKALQE